MKAPDRIMEWVKRHYREEIAYEVFAELMDAATGNRPVTPWQLRALASIFPEYRTTKSGKRIPSHGS